ncbi:MAG: response regulator [Methylococcaceae bacterium]
MNTINSVLVVDDSDVDFDLISWGFKQNGFEPLMMRGKTAEEGLEILTKNDDPQGLTCGFPIMILLDIKMPGMGGFGFLKKLDELGFGKKIPVIMLSSSSNPGDMTVSYQLGATGFVRKPASLMEYAAKMKDVMALCFVRDTDQ